MIRVRLSPLAIELSSDGAERLVDLLDEASEQLTMTGAPLSCRGARCGACRVRVAAGHSSLSEARQDERATLTWLGAGTDERLACQLELRADAREDVTLVFPAPRP